MKLELIKEIDFEGKIWYYISKDGRFVSGSLKSKFDDAFAIYKTIKDGIILKKEVILSDDILG